MNEAQNNLVEVNATISRLERDPDAIDEFSYRPVFRYQLNGETYEARKNIYKGKSDKVGQTKTILIDPTNPHTFKYQHDLTLVDMGPAQSQTVPKPENIQVLGKNYRKISAKCKDVFQTPDSRKNYPSFNAEFSYVVNGQEYSTKNSLNFSYADSSIGIPLVGQIFELYVAEDDPEDVFLPQPDRSLVGISETSAPVGESIISDSGKTIIGIIIAVVMLLVGGSVAYSMINAFNAENTEAGFIIIGVFAAIFIAGVIFAIQNRPKVKRVSNSNDTTVNWVPTPVQTSNLRLFETGGQAAILMSSFDISYQAGGKTITENIKTKTPLGNKMIQRLQLKVSANNPKQIFIDGIQ